MAGSAKTSSGVSESSAVSSAVSSGGSNPSSGASSSGSSNASGQCQLFASNIVFATENLITFDLVNGGDGDVLVTDMGFDIATPVFAPPPPFTVTQGATVSVSMTTVLSNVGGEISILNDCNGLITIPT